MLASVLVVFSPSSRVLASEPPDPAVEACAGKRDGDACLHSAPTKVDGELREQVTPGVCGADQCCELDYSAGSPPATRCSSCLTCKAGPATPKDAAAPAPNEEPPRVNEEPPASAGQVERGCAIAGDRNGAALLLAVIAFTRSRRRVRSR